MHRASTVDLTWNRAKKRARQRATCHPAGLADRLIRGCSSGNEPSAGRQAALVRRPSSAGRDVPAERSESRSREPRMPPWPMPCGATSSPRDLARSSAPKQPLQWPDLAEDQLTPRSPMAQQRRHNFLPLPAAPSFLSRQESSSFAVRPQAYPSKLGTPGRGAPSIVSGPSIAIEAAMVRARDFRSRRTDMATIGTFKKTGSE